MAYFYSAPMAWNLTAVDSIGPSALTEAMGMLNHHFAAAA